MPVTLSYPGVYLDEINSLSLSIGNAATAVPLFTFPPAAPLDFIPSGQIELLNAMVQGKATAIQESLKTITPLLATDVPKAAYLSLTVDASEDGLHFTDAEKAMFVGAFGTNFKPNAPVFLYVESWMDYSSKIAPYLLLAKTLLAHSFTAKDDTLNSDTFEKNFKNFVTLLKGVGYYAMRHYFFNGGGACHIALNLKPTGSDAAVDSALETAVGNYVAEHPDITLFCPAVGEKNADAGLISSVQQSRSLPPFCLAAANFDKGKVAIDKPVVQEQAAAYYPWLKLNASYLDALPQDKFRIALTTGSNAKSIQTFDSLGASVKKLLQDKLTELSKNNNTVTLSPVFAVAGAYCLTDGTRGVWKAPANVALTGVIGLCDQTGKEVFVSDTLNTDLMKASINAIRFFTGEGYRIWGARTLTEPEKTDWRYIPVRRLFNSAETDIRDAMRMAVFEPNSPPTWEIVRAAIDNYLHSLWQQGALAGDKPEDAYFVRVGLNVTMTATDIADGKMIVKVGMAAVRPAEFIILEFSQKQM